jgi:two-component system heavy metal sensor histidine kinase CusS
VRVWITVVSAVLITALLAWWVSSRGLAPLRNMADKAAEITPNTLSARLDIKNTPTELQSLAMSFNAMLDRLSSGYERLLQFSADLAHEVRTPIGVLIGQTQVTLAHTRSESEYKSVLESNLEELERLGRIAQNILFLAQADHDRHEITRASLNIHEQLETIATYFEGLADERNLSFDVQAEGEMFANAIMSQRAISNVVVNAVRYAEPGTMIRLTGSEDAQGARIVIGNQGKPVSPEELARLFDRFYRGDAARSEFTESSGLGLAIVQAIMRLHGGSASASCSADGWIEFTLRFAAAPI